MSCLDAFYFLTIGGLSFIAPPMQENNEDKFKVSLLVCRNPTG